MRWYFWVIIVSVIILSISLLYLMISKKNKDSKMTTKELMYIVSFSTLAIVLGFIEIPLGTIIPGGKIDFSEVVILVSLLILGVKNTSFVIILRSLVRILIPNELDLLLQILGELIAITASFIIVYSTIIFNKLLKKNNRPLLYAVSIDDEKPNVVEYITLPLITTFNLVILLFIFHYFITVPMYAKIYAEIYVGFKEKFMVILPFTILNIIKGVISPLVYLIVKPQIEKMVN